MDHAEDRRGQVIRAKNASSGPFYRCPVCRAEVFLRSGKYRVRHFAHKAGQGRPECEHFHPSDHVRGTWPYPRYGDDMDGPPLPPLALSIELDPVPEARLKGLRAWQLALTVPKAPDTHGSITVDCGSGPPRTITLAKLSVAPQTYPASLEAADFGQIWISPEVRPRYRAAIEPRIPGLDRSLVNVFTQTKEKQKPLSNSLAWGDSYYFVWHTALAVDIPQSLPSSPLAKRGDWACSLVALPDEDDEDVRTWIEETCHLTIARTQRSWALIYPPVLGLNSLGSLSVSSTTHLLFAVHSPHDQTTEGNTLTCFVGSASASVANSAGTHFFEVRHDSNSNTPVALTWDSFAFPEITKATSENLRDSYGVAFTFRSRMGAERYEAFLHQSNFEQLLRRVRGMELDISAVLPPPGTKGRFLSRRDTGSDWSAMTPEVDLNGQDSGKDVSVRQINALIQDISLDICIDFGTFGMCYLPRSIPEPHDGMTVRIPLTVRNRIIWFCTVARSYAATRKRAPLVMSDEALLHHFQKIATPPSLIAHRRLLEHQIEIATSRGARQ
jgi:hypothetical protein